MKTLLCCLYMFVTCNPCFAPKAKEICTKPFDNFIFIHWNILRCQRSFSTFPKAHFLFFNSKLTLLRYTNLSVTANRKYLVHDNTYQEQVETLLDIHKSVAEWLLKQLFYSKSIHFSTYCPFLFNLLW